MKSIESVEFKRINRIKSSQQKIYCMYVFFGYFFGSTYIEEPKTKLSTFL